MSERTIQEVLDANPGCKRFTAGPILPDGEWEREYLKRTGIQHYAIIPGLRPVQRDRLEELREWEREGPYRRMGHEILSWAIAKIEAARENCKRQLLQGSGYGHAWGCGCTHCNHARDFLKD